MQKPAGNNDASAFPHYDDVLKNRGLTMRDYFAAHILPALIERMPCLVSLDGTALAREAYAHADAMVRARGVDVASESTTGPPCLPAQVSRWELHNGNLVKAPT